jgi:protein-S-isoprenylcysteine O-methyltransferase Ste14
VIGQGKAILTNIIEILFSVGLLCWTYLLIINSLHINPGFLPASLIIHSIHKVYLRIPGMILISIGMIIFISGINAFKNSWRIGIDTNTRDVLITTGIFSYTRNPIFLFLNIYFIGTSLIYPTPFFISFALLTLIGIHHHIRTEEKFLKEHYGKPYLEYHKKVRRYI